MDHVQGTHKKAGQDLIKEIEHKQYQPLAIPYKYVGLGLAMLYLLAALIALPHYFPWSSVNFILGLVGLPLAISSGPVGPPSLRFYPVALLFALACFILPENTILFFALGTAAICVCEHVWHRLSFVALFTLAFMSTTVQYLAGIFSFPLRLSLTRSAAVLLNLTGKPASAAGNLISFGGQAYSVDPACMGVKMLLTSLLFGLFIIAIFQKKQQRFLKWYWVLFSLTLVFGLNLVSNIVRILILVFFDIGPGNVMHEITGLLCLGIYVLAPSAWAIKNFVARFGQLHGNLNREAGRDLTGMRYIVLQGVLLVAVLSALAFKTASPQPLKPALAAVAGYTASWYHADVLRYTNGRSLVYVKRMSNPLGSEHNPVMCWIGAGYQFQQLMETSVNGTHIYAGTLKKGNELLYTAWWFDNGRHKTTSQLEWRWRVLKGDKPYSVINVTTSTKGALDAELNRIIGEAVFVPALLGF